MPACGAARQGSAIDLHAYVPGEYSRSQAQGLFIDGATVMVVGSAYNINEGRNEAILWIDSPPLSVGEPLRDAEFAIAPSPLRSYATLRYALSAPSMVTLDLHDVRGRLFDRLIDSAQSSGTHAVIWRGTDAEGVKQASGAYSYDFYAGERPARGKLTIPP